MSSPRAPGNDLCELFGYAPNDRSDAAQKHWDAKDCPFVGGQCIKHSHPSGNDPPLVYGSCSVTNRLSSSKREDVIICPQRLYADNYRTLRDCARDAGIGGTIYLAKEYALAKNIGSLPPEYCVLLGKNSGREIELRNPGVIEMSLDWVMAYVRSTKLEMVVPCEVQSIDTTGNYRNNWDAYAYQRAVVPSSKHGMNWANVWKRLIPQLIMKSAVAARSALCTKGTYFVVPTRVYEQFKKVVGDVAQREAPGPGIITVMKYSLDEEVAPGEHRHLVHCGMERMLAVDFAQSFASGRQLPMGEQLDIRVKEALAAL